MAYIILNNCEKLYVKLNFYSFQVVKMPLFYSVVARGLIVLCKHANYQGNFAEILEGVLTQIGPENKKQSLLHDRYLYHYICEDQIIYMCITDDVSF